MVFFEWPFTPKTTIFKKPKNILWRIFTITLMFGSYMI